MRLLEWSMTMTDDDEQMMQRFAKVSLTGLVGFAALFVVLDRKSVV